jgi:hypothetical protein
MPRDVARKRRRRRPPPAEDLVRVEVHIDRDAAPLDPGALDAAVAEVILESVAGDQAGAQKRPRKPR